MRLSLFLVLSLFVVSAQAGSLSPKQLIQLERACKSSDPVLVYDNFRPEKKIGPPPTIDLNGDGTPDIYHGEFVEKLVQLGGRDTEILPLFGQITLPDLESTVADLVDRLEKKEVSYSRINFSQEMPLKLASFKSELFPEDPSVPEITAENIGQYKNKILERLWNERPDFRLQELFELFQRLERLGVPFVVAAGNFGPGYVNVFSLLPGVISVGSLNLDGSKRASSADNSLVQVWKTGSFVPVLVADGIDLNSDGQADYRIESLSQEAVIADLYRGKPVAGSVLQVSEKHIEWSEKLAASKLGVPNASLNVLPAGLYLVEDIVTLPTVTAGTARLFRASGKYAYKAPGGMAPNVFFDDDGAGNIVFDPLKTGIPGQLTVISGTSFSAPVICN